MIGLKISEYEKLDFLGLLVLLGMGIFFILFIFVSLMCVIHFMNNEKQKGFYLNIIAINAICISVLFAGDKLYQTVEDKKSVLIKQYEKEILNKELIVEEVQEFVVLESDKKGKEVFFTASEESKMIRVVVVTAEGYQLEKELAVKIKREPDRKTAQLKYIKSNEVLGPYGKGVYEAVLVVPTK